MLHAGAFYKLYFMFANSSVVGLMTIGSVADIVKQSLRSYGLDRGHVIAVGNAGGRVMASVPSERRLGKEVKIGIRLKLTACAPCHHEFQF